ncbi:hypothetical protein OHD50_08055 [Escherichia coli]|nr:hypothetical protein [Escherichia coli]
MLEGYHSVMQRKVVATPKAGKTLEHEETPELAAKLAAEAIERDAWTASGESTFATKTGRTGGLKCWKRARQHGMSAFALSQQHLNNRGAQKLAEALSSLKGSTVELTIVEDDNPRCVRRWSGVRRYTKKNLRRRASPLCG